MFYFRDDISRSLFLGVYRAPTSVNFPLLFSKDVLRKLFLFRPKLILSDGERKIEIRNRPCGKRTGHTTYKDTARTRLQWPLRESEEAATSAQGCPQWGKDGRIFPGKRRKREERGETYGTFLLTKLWQPGEGELRGRRCGVKKVSWGHKKRKGEGGGEGEVNIWKEAEWAEKRGKRRGGFLVLVLLVVGGRGRACEKILGDKKSFLGGKKGELWQVTRVVQQRRKVKKGIKWVISHLLCRKIVSFEISPWKFAEYSNSSLLLCCKLFAIKVLFNRQESPLKIKWFAVT